MKLWKRSLAILAIVALFFIPAAAYQADQVDKHVEKSTVVDLIVTPTHGDRDQTEFRRSVAKLKADGHYKCFVTGKTDSLQVHHIAEFSQANNVDFDKLQRFLLIFDPYGYSKAMAGQPITTIDDIRNMIVLDQDHHTGVNSVTQSGIGIHRVTFPTFVAQVVAKDGKNPVPQRGESLDAVLKRIE